MRVNLNDDIANVSNSLSFNLLLESNTIITNAKTAIDVKNACGKCINCSPL